MRHLIALAFTLAVAPAFILTFAPALASGPVPIGGLAWAQGSPGPMIHGAEVRISAKKWDDAQQFLLEEAIPAFPQNAELWYWLGVVYAQGSKRDTEEAAKAFAKANELAGPEDTELKPKIENAVKAIWGPLVNAAAKAADTGELAQAETLLKQAVEINPEGAEGWINLGTVYLRQKKSVEAVGAYEKALALQPENATISYNLGITYHQLGRDELGAGDSAKAAEYLGRAETTYASYLKENPGDVAIITSLAGLYQDRGEDAKVAETLKAVFDADSVAQEDYFNAGLVFLRAKDYPNAERAFGQVIVLSDSTEPRSLESMGLVLVQQKKFDQATGVLQKLIALQPDNATAYEYMGFAYRDSGRTEEAAKAFAKAADLRKNTPGPQAEKEDSSQ